MKRFSLLTSTLLGFVTASLQAGEAVAYKQVAPPPPPLYGTGFYGAIDMGANVFQNRGGDRTFTNEFGDTLTIDPKNDVGFFGGIKLGYVWGTGVFRPTFEGDFFYNGFRGGADSTLTIDGVVVRSSSLTTWINTGAFMGNFIGRFAFGRFQPYAGAGVGIYFAESAGADLTTPRGSFSTGGGESHADLAWQIIAGTDYYWTPKFSTFIEYKFLNYTSTQIDTNEDRDLRQHLVGAGVRFHF
jgi:opacity protein-like surface antigen